MLFWGILSIEYPQDARGLEENAFRKIRNNMKNRRGSGDATGTHCVTSREMAAFEEPWWSCNVHDGGGQAKLEQSNSPVQSPWKVKDQLRAEGFGSWISGLVGRRPRHARTLAGAAAFVRARFRKFLESIWLFFFSLRRSSACQDVSRSRVTPGDMTGGVAEWHGHDTKVAWHLYRMKHLFLQKNKNNGKSHLLSND